MAEIAVAGSGEQWEKLFAKLEHLELTLKEQKQQSPPKEDADKAAIKQEVPSEWETFHVPGEGALTNGLPRFKKHVQKVVFVCMVLCLVTIVLASISGSSVMGDRLGTFVAPWYVGVSEEQSNYKNYIGLANHVLSYGDYLDNILYTDGECGSSLFCKACSGNNVITEVACFVTITIAAFTFLASYARFKHNSVQRKFIILCVLLLSIIVMLCGIIFFKSGCLAFHPESQKVSFLSAAEISSSCACTGIANGTSVFTKQSTTLTVVYKPSVGMFCALFSLLFMATCFVLHALTPANSLQNQLALLHKNRQSTRDLGSKSFELNEVNSEELRNWNVKNDEPTHDRSSDNDSWRQTRQNPIVFSEDNAADWHAQNNRNPFEEDVA